jgi:hypothetical protein
MITRLLIGALFTFAIYKIIKFFVTFEWRDKSKYL